MGAVAVDMSISIAVGGALLAIGAAVARAISTLRLEEGTARMRAIAAAIREGASAFLRREYAVVFACTVLLAVTIVFAFGPSAGGLELALGFLLGAAGSAASGALGVLVSVRANARTTAVAMHRDLRATVRVAFRAGSVTGLGVTGLATLVLVGCYLAFGRDVHAMVGLLVGASLISLFARVGGGIYTKGADTGADLVGKLEIQLPEDDARNPAVIADNVGDNVGDCAGTAADLFETYLVTVVAAMLLGERLDGVRAVFPNAVLFPVAVSGCGIVASWLGTAFVRVRPGGTIASALFRGLAATVALAALGIYLLDRWFMHSDGGVLVASLTGLVVVAVFVALTMHYTSPRGRSVASIVRAAEAGAGPVIVTGLAIGLRSAAVPAVVIALGTLTAFFATGWISGGQIDPALGTYGIALAATSMLSVLGMILSIDVFGPIADNAGGIAEMAALSANVRRTTDELDAVGNTTKALTKGYAIGSAALAALSLFAAYTLAAAEDLGVTWTELTARLTIDDPWVLAGLVLGASLPFFFTSVLMNAVSVTAQAVVREVRRQFAEIPGLVRGEAQPQYAACVAIITAASLRQLIAPALIAVVAPLAVGVVLGPFALAGMLLGVVISGLPLALVMTTSGAAWDNAKKYIESGHAGGTSSPAHGAAVVGDLVGDTTKDTAGPAINPLVKVVNTVALLSIGLMAKWEVIELAWR